MADFRALSRHSTVWVVAWLVPAAYAAHPLITDDTGTQGTGHWQLEVNTDHTRAQAHGATWWARQLNTTLTRGITDELDLAVNVPLLRQTAPGESAVSGLGDVTVQAKWRLVDNGQGWTLGVRPSFTLPTGSSDKGLGNGRVAGSAVLLSQLEAGDWAWLVNAGYVYNANRMGARKHLWTTSTALSYKLDEAWSLVGEVGALRSAGGDGPRVGKFALLGAIYRVNEKTDLDIGWRRTLGGLLRANTLGVGLTLRW